MIDKQARDEAIMFGSRLSDTPTAKRLGKAVLACPKDNDEEESLKIYNQLRPEIYGRLMPIIVGTVEFAYQEAPRRQPLGIRTYKSAESEASLSWKNIESSLYLSLWQDASEQYINNPDAQELFINPLKDLLQCASSLVIGAHSEPAVAISHGIHTAVSACVTTACSMQAFLVQKYPDINPDQREQIIQNSNSVVKQLAIGNLEQIDVLSSLWYNQTALVEDLEFIEKRNLIKLKYGSINYKPIPEKMAQNAGLRLGADTTKAKVGDLEKPFSHIGCPITFKPKTVDTLWDWAISVMQKGELFRV